MATNAGATDTAPSGAVAAATALSKDKRAIGWRKSAGWLLMTIVPTAIWFAPFHLEAAAKHAIAITLLMIAGWAFEVMDPGLLGIIGCYLFWALGVVKVDVAFSGFADDTSWFVMGAILFGAMAERSGVARRIAYNVMLRIGTSYSRLLLGLIIADAVMTLFVPSGVPRVIIMATIAIGLIEAFGLGPGSNIGRGMLLILTYAASVFDKTIIAGAATIMARGAIQQFGHVEVLYSQWLLAYLPADILIILVAWRLILRFFPPESSKLAGGREYLENELAKMGRWKPVEKRSLVLMALAIALWMTDFLHHISPSVVGLGIGLLAVLPIVGVLDIEDLKRVNYLVVFFIGAVISMGKVLTATKSIDVLTRALFAWLTPVMGHSAVSSFALYWTGFVYHIFLASGISMLGTSIPGLMNYATTHHLNALALGMVWTFSSGATIFMYQNAVLIVGYSYGYFTSKDLFRLGLWLSVVDSLLLLIIVPFYWPLIGIGR